MLCAPYDQFSASTDAGSPRQPVLFARDHTHRRVAHRKIERRLQHRIRIRAIRRLEQCNSNPLQISATMYPSVPHSSPAAARAVARRLHRAANLLPRRRRHLVRLIQPPAVDAQLVDPIRRHFLVELDRRLRVVVHQARRSIHGQLPRRRRHQVPLVVPEHAVEEHIHALGVRRVHQLLRIGKRAELRIDLKIVPRVSSRSHRASDSARPLRTTDPATESNTGVSQIAFIPVLWM